MPSKNMNSSGAGAGLSAIDRRDTVVAETTRRLLDYLLSGDVTPGQRIPPERQLAEDLAVGRSTVREAIKSLSLLGLLDVRQGDGTYLTGSTSELLPRVIEWGLLLGERPTRDLIEVRRHLETIVAGLAAERADDEAVAAVAEAFDQMQAVVEDVDAYVEADIAFHLRLADASGNQILADILRSIRSLLRVWAARVLEHAGETESSLAMHRPIVEAIASHDPVAARKAMEAHMDRAQRRLQAALEAAR